MPHILSVADVETTQIRTRKLLEGSGYSSSTARNGAEALERYRARRPDGVLIEVGGVAAKPLPILRELRHADPHARIAVVHPGSVADLDALTEEREATQLLVKPFDPTRWLRAIEALVNLRGTRRYARVRTMLRNAGDASRGVADPMPTLST